jgi:hypothetical protein
MLCRPGITGAATILFSHEEGMIQGVPEEMVERYVTTVLNPEKCRLDVEYMETTCFRNDVKILLNTLFKLSRRSRATRTAESARFVVVWPGVEKNMTSITVLDDGEFVTQDVRQSA